MELKINNKIFALNGCIGRREYILNMMIINAVTTLLCMPFSYWMAKYCQNPMEIFNFPALFASAPISVMFFYTLACLICTFFHYGLILRRFADIRAKQANPWIYFFVGVLILIPYVWILKMNAWTALFFIVSIIINVVIMCIKGQISSQLPHDELKRFNWGAFWGTWIWGLFNKTPITLLMIPLLFTPASFTFMIICGIKGNEWAFRNTKALDDETFHKKQKNQAIFWNSLMGFLFFVLPLLLPFIIATTAMTIAVKNPEKLEKFANVTEEFFEDLIIQNFDDYELDIDENKFYVDPETWINLTYSERYDLLKSAAGYASMKKTKSSNVKFEGYNGSKTTEMEITKIYSSYNGEILAEFNVDNINEESIRDFKSAISTFMNALYFNANPQLPPKHK